MDAISKFRSFLGRVRWHCLGGMRARALKDERMHQKPSVLEVLSHPPAARRLAGVVNTNSVVRPTITEQGPTAAARTPTTVLEAATTPYACQWCWAAFFCSEPEDRVLLSSCLTVLVATTPLPQGFLAIFS